MTAPNDQGARCQRQRNVHDQVHANDQQQATSNADDETVTQAFWTGAERPERRHREACQREDLRAVMDGVVASLRTHESGPHRQCQEQGIAPCDQAHEADERPPEREGREPRHGKHADLDGQQAQRSTDGIAHERGSVRPLGDWHPNRREHRALDSENIVGRERFQPLIVTPEVGSAV